MFGLAIAIALFGTLLQMSGHEGLITRVGRLLVPLIIVLVLLVRGHQGSKLKLAVIVSVPLAISAVLGLFIEPPYQPPATALVALNIILVVVVGFPLGLYSSPNKPLSTGADPMA